jgi:hypothetical protein
MTSKLGGGARMDKQEILAKSQEENKGRDVADLDAQKMGSYIGFLASAVFGIVVMVLDWYFFGRTPYEITTIICCFDACMYSYKFIKLRRKETLSFAIIWIILTIVWLSLYILQLTGAIN